MMAIRGLQGRTLVMPDHSLVQKHADMRFKETLARVVYTAKCTEKNICSVMQ